MIGRLKFQIDNLVNEMLDQLPERVWVDPMVTFLDPAMGGGQFLIQIVRRLREHGHSEVNIQSRVFGVESNQGRINYVRSVKRLNVQFGVGGYDFDYEGEFGVKKFDVVVGNPPYNKNLIKKTESVYYHQGMNSEKEGYIGFTIVALETLLSKNGVLIFITPGKFMVGTGAIGFRKWLVNNYNLTDIIVKPTDVFKGVGVDKVVIFKVENSQYRGETIIHNLNKNKVIMDIRNNDDYIIPDFESQAIYDIFLKMNNDAKINPRTSKSVGGYGDEFKKNFSPDKIGLFTTKVARTITGPDKVEYEYTDLPPTVESKNWRVIINMSFGKEFAVIPPGVEHDHTKLGFCFSTKQEADEFYKWVQSDLFKKFWNGLAMTRHTHVFIRYIPFKK